MNRLGLAVILYAAALQAATPQNSAFLSPSTSSAAYQGLNRLLRVLPEDVRADVLLRVSKYVEPQTKKQLALKAYDLATKANWKFRREFVFGNVDSLEGIESRVESLNLDTLSLRLRSLSLLGSVDSIKAMDLWSSLSFPRDDNLGCDSRFIKDSSDFFEEIESIYEALPPHAREAFVSQALQKGADPSDLLALLLLSTSHPDALGGSGVGKAPLRIDSYQIGNRSFIHLADKIIERSSALLGALPANDIRGAVFAKGIRDYLSANFQYPRCLEELDRERGEIPRWAVLHLDLISMPRGINQLNVQLRRFGIQTISRGDLVPRDVRQAHDATLALWKAPSSRKVLESLQYLNSEVALGEQCHRAVNMAMQLPKWKNDYQEGLDEYAVEKTLSYKTLLDKCADDSEAFHQILQKFAEDPAYGQGASFSKSLEAWISANALSKFHPRSVKDIELLTHDQRIKNRPIILAYCYLSALRLFAGI
jgi:hypothetical protein